MDENDFDCPRCEAANLEVIDRQPLTLECPSCGHMIVDPPVRRAEP